MHMFHLSHQKSTIPVGPIYFYAHVTRLNGLDTPLLAFCNNLPPAN